MNATPIARASVTRRLSLAVGVFLMSVLCTGTSRAQESAPPVLLAHTEFRTIDSNKIGQRYYLLISLPDDYKTSGISYPVLYVIDGWHFPLMAFMQQNNAFSKKMPPIIIVTISHGATAETSRTRDFTPTKVKERPGSGGGAAFLDFLEHDIIPFTDRTYRTVPTDRALLGHSLGGLFVLYALEHRPGLFQRLIAASPAIAWDNRMLFSAFEHLKQLPAQVRLDLSVGGDERSRDDLAAFAKLLDTTKPANLDYRFTIYPGENHDSVRLSSFPAAMYWAYRQ
ncbi:MAG TPA: alpha/beta hydrolase-fold protein [Pyrinomonadaceae bacterium]|nr:alpha/beta hydrolase-fold protein [Pyrinomonadaceae bacterium]